MLPLGAVHRGAVGSCAMAKHTVCHALVCGSCVTAVGIPHGCGGFTRVYVWVVVMTCGSTLLAVDSLFRQDFDDGALELLLMSPHPLFVLVFAKVLAHWIVTSLPLICAAPFLGAMLFLEGNTLGVVMLTLLLGTPVLSMISAIGAALTVGLRKGGVLIAIIALPLYVPVLIFGTSAIQAAAMGLPFVGQLAYLGALLALALTFAPFAIAAGLRVSVSG